LTGQASNTCERVVAEETRDHLKTVALRTYSTCQKQRVDEKRVVEFLPMVKKIAQRVVSYLKPPLSFEDLISAGTIGLVKAARDYDPAREAEFKTYAYVKIKGAILDELRSLSLLPPNLNKKIRTAMRVSRRISEETGAAPADEELADQLGVTLGELQKTFEGARAKHFISLDSFREDNAGPGNMPAETNAWRPDQKLERTELIDQLAEAIAQLNERQRQTVLLYYQQNLTMKQIAEILKITESRVSQLHASALFNLSVKLRHWEDGG
jgi:RNA polymerase sigma factor for flagellar operon FliA